MNQDVTGFIQALNESWQAELCTRLCDVVHKAVPAYCNLNLITSKKWFNLIYEHKCIHSKSENISWG
jgi:hypothetical protein